MKPNISGEHVDLATILSSFLSIHNYVSFIRAHVEEQFLVELVQINHPNFL
jgi:hypothetical protein